MHERDYELPATIPLEPLENPLLRDILGQPLSPRQSEVIILAAMGMSRSQIGRELEISPGTVTNHKRVVWMKLGVNSTTEAICRLIDEDKIDFTKIIPDGFDSTTIDGLLEAEKRVLEAMTEDKGRNSQKQIAHNLGIPIRKIKTHSSAIFKKTGIRNKQNAIALVHAGLL